MQRQNESSVLSVLPEFGIVFYSEDRCASRIKDALWFSDESGSSAFLPYPQVAILYTLAPSSRQVVFMDDAHGVTSVSANEFFGLTKETAGRTAILAAAVRPIDVSDSEAKRNLISVLTKEIGTPGLPPNSRRMILHLLSGVDNTVYGIRQGKQRSNLDFVAHVLQHCGVGFGFSKSEWEKRNEVAVKNSGDGPASAEMFVPIGRPVGPDGKFATAMLYEPLATTRDTSPHVFHSIFTNMGFRRPRIEPQTDKHALSYRVEWLLTYPTTGPAQDKKLSVANYVVPVPLYSAPVSTIEPTARVSAVQNWSKKDAEWARTVLSQFFDNVIFDAAFRQEFGQQIARHADAPAMQERMQKEIVGDFLKDTMHIVRGMLVEERASAGLFSFMSAEARAVADTCGINHREIGIDSKSTAEDLISCFQHHQRSLPASSEEESELNYII